MPSQMKLKIYFNYIFVVMITLTLLEIGDTKQLYGKNLHQIVKKQPVGSKFITLEKSSENCFVSRIIRKNCPVNSITRKI